MLHFIRWKLSKLDDQVLVVNDLIWVKWYYFGTKKEWEFYLYPSFDSNHNTINYAIFDEKIQLDLFSRFIKISWVWLRTASYLSTWYLVDELLWAISSSDVWFFTKIPWIWPKTAKKIIIEIKDKIDLSDIDKMEENQKIKQDVVKTLVNLWYSKKKIETFLKDHNTGTLDKNLIIKEFIKKW